MFTVVTNSLTDTSCEDANSKLVEVVTVADVDAEDHVGNSLLMGADVWS